MKKQTSHHLHLIRVILFGVLLTGVLVTRLDADSFSQIARPGAKVLPYATSMSREALLAACNSSRQANGLPAMSMSTKLNSSAQAKAQHMADNNYWAHVAPDGIQPWYFFEAASYSYAKAGENLAYGFETADTTNQGWMDSPGHRANILGDYTEVGFGFVNSADFQGHENTIVVAHYARPLTYAAQPVEQPSSTPPSPPVASQPPQPTPSQTTPPQESTPQMPQGSGNASGRDGGNLENPSTPPEHNKETTPADSSDADRSNTFPATPVSTGSNKNITVFESLKNGAASPAAIIGLGLTMSSMAGYAATHRKLVKHAITTGERYLVAHPVIDISILVVAFALILTTTAAHLL